MKAAETRIRLPGAGCRWLGPSGLRFIDMTGRQRRRGVCHLEISPSPFKWEVSGRALRTVSAGEQSRKSPGPAETEQGCALRLRPIYAPQHRPPAAPPPQAATPPLPPRSSHGASPEPLRTSSRCPATLRGAVNAVRNYGRGGRAGVTEVFSLVSLVSEDFAKCEKAARCFSCAPELSGAWRLLFKLSKTSLWDIVVKFRGGAEPSSASDA